MKRNITCVAPLTIILLALPLTAAADMTPGLYEYTIKTNMAGVPANMPMQTSQRCLSAKDVAGNAAFQAPPSPNNDCQMKDLIQTGSQFSYSVSCTKPEKIDSKVKGTFTATSMTMDMTMSTPNAPGPITQTISARRIGDCKQ